MFGQKLNKIIRFLVILVFKLPKCGYKVPMEYNVGIVVNYNIQSELQEIALL